MAYATRQDLIDRFGEDELIQLTDRVNLPASTIDEDMVAAHIADAENLADSYLAKLYRLPLDPVPAVLTRIICEIARYFLHGRRTDKDDPVTRDYALAIAWLKDVARGTVQLEAEGAASSQTSGGQVQVSAPDRVFSRDTLIGF
ncbi:DUF1320 domain-containing protein [Roseibium sp. CAU 1637]|uniref:DUF1320 domain-containing protein n=1 Tax=Roseibium limicola TaxID=2816037 RepID=A0A939ES01_9HYPH|nr:DUF1320 domain-containing protein [Roseibium limicola]MBO0346039.1 DUF1320 domain-containing protein [Roseibium limicola]